MDLSGSTVLVTGASSGIGRDTAILLSLLNAKVVLTGRNRDRLEQTLACLSGRGHHMSVFDMNCVEEIPKWIRSLVSEVGPLGGLVHAAGKQLALPIRQVTAESMQGVLRTNLESSIMLVRGFCRKGCHAPVSSVVFISSVMGVVGKPVLSVYSASKAALIGLARSLAVELAADSIRVNCVAPAFVETEMLAQWREMLLPEQFEALEKEHPLGFGKARDVANAVAFLIADTGRWITGSTLVVDGGYSA